MSSADFNNLWKCKVTGTIGFVKLVEDFKKYTKATSGNVVKYWGNSRSGWQNPDHGLVRVNSDAAMLPGNAVGLGVVMHDDAGLIVAATVRRVVGDGTVVGAEVLAVRLGVCLAARLGFQKVVECDSLAVIKAIKKHTVGLTPFDLIIEDITMVGSSFVSLSCNHVRRNGNVVAHSMARVLPQKSFFTPFRKFAGFIDLDDKTGGSLFYYFVEAEKDPDHKPLTLWLNGESCDCNVIRGIITAYSNLPKSDYVMVMVAKMRRSWANDEDAFNHFFSALPSSWLAVPFSDTLSRDKICNSLGFFSDSMGLLVDHHQKVVEHKPSLGQTAGKHVLLYIDQVETPSDTYYTLLEWYNQNKTTRIADFEVVFVHFDGKASTSLGSPKPMPWLVCPFDPQHTVFVKDKIPNTYKGILAAFDKMAISLHCLLKIFKTRLGLRASIIQWLAQ
uniref:RNase H type-1 domain-containing protein n=1 Tax=Chenopodium quinoa TaxID=63459 RepID=A0A803N1P9_CHEQI